MHLCLHTSAGQVFRCLFSNSSVSPCHYRRLPLQTHVWRPVWDQQRPEEGGLKILMNREAIRWILTPNIRVDSILLNKWIKCLTCLFNLTQIKLQGMWGLLAVSKHYPVNGYREQFVFGLHLVIRPESNYSTLMLSFADDILWKVSYLIACISVGADVEFRCPSKNFERLLCASQHSTEEKWDQGWKWESKRKNHCLIFP